MAGSYHHGDLRRALLEQAASVIDESGIGALSLRDLARRAGVSPTAPYHHFSGKADLVRALAEEALEELDAGLAEASEAHEDAEGRLRAIGVAYVLFAVDHPDRFRLAFRPEVGDPFARLGDTDQALPENVTAFRHLAAVVRDLVPPGREGALAVAAWSIVHGLAALLVDGPLRILATDRVRVRALAESATARLTIM